MAPASADEQKESSASKTLLFGRRIAPIGEQPRPKLTTISMRRDWSRISSEWLEQV